MDKCPLGDDNVDSDGDGIPDACDIEECDGVDNDGDGEIDEDLDCTEVCDGIDNNRDGEIDEGFDSDNDGTPDCDDTEECDGLDNDGDGEIDEGLNCDGPVSGCETAYARYADSATCFDPAQVGANRWGWTNYFAVEGEYSMDLYAAAGQCDLSKGTRTGEVKVVYSNGMVTVSAELLPGFVMTQAHLYVGDVPYPLKNGSPTVANGQLGHTKDPLNDVTTVEFDAIDVSNYPEGVHVIFHAETCEKVAAIEIAKTSVTAYPMTFKNDLNLKVEIPYDAQLKVEIFDINGRCIMTKKGMNVRAGSNDVRMNVSGLTPAMYILIINTGREKIMKKVMSKK